MGDKRFDDAIKSGAVKMRYVGEPSLTRGGLGENVEYGYLMGDHIYVWDAVYGWIVWGYKESEDFVHILELSGNRFNVDPSENATISTKAFNTTLEKFAEEYLRITNLMPDKVVLKVRQEWCGTSFTQTMWFEKKEEIVGDLIMYADGIEVTRIKNDSKTE